jgi:short-subunit dehydrogenase
MTYGDGRPLALVTGASAGIGLALAEELARRGFDLVAVADDAAIGAAAEHLREAGGARVTALRLDLADPAAVDAAWRAVEEDGRPLAVAVLNAGIGAGGAFATGITLQDDLRVVDVNVRSTVHLAKRVTQDMVRHGGGRIMLTSSIAAALPGPYQATYDASKAFVQSLGMALRAELREHGVSVTLLMPGPTDTTFFTRNDMDDTRLAAGPKDPVADVARAGVEALLSGDERAVASSLRTRLLHLGGRFLPDAVKGELVRHMVRPGSRH